VVVGPIIPDVALDDLKTLQEASLRDRAAVDRWVETTAANEEVSRALVRIDEQVPVQFIPLGVKTAQLAEAVGVVTVGELKQRVTGDIRPGDRVMVTGSRHGVKFWRLMDVGQPLTNPGRTILRMAVTDADLSRD
jgi:hypothetical protein